MMSKQLFQKVIKFDDLRLELVPESSLKINNEASDLMESMWQDMTLEAKLKEFEIYNGILIPYNTFQKP